MNTLRSIAALTILLIVPLALHASPSDALAVLQQCGAPLHDSVLRGTGEYAGPQRVLTYRSATLHFQQSAGGWNFVFANPAGSTRMRDRAQTEVLLPCFGKAMYNVQLYAPLKSTQQPVEARPPTFAQRLLRPTTYGLRPLGLVPILLLYLLPSIIGLIRRAPRLGRLVAVDLFLGWTIVGWVYALLLASKDAADIEGEASVLNDLPLLATDTIGLNLSRTEQDAAFNDAYFVRPGTGQPVATNQANATAVIPQRPTLVPEQERASTVERTQAPSFAFTSKTSPQAAPEPIIQWIDFYTTRRRCRIDVVSTAHQVTVYDIDISQRGFDPLNREVIGGYVGKTFMVFPMENILQLRDLAA